MTKRGSFPKGMSKEGKYGARHMMPGMPMPKKKKKKMMMAFLLFFLIGSTAAFAQEWGTDVYGHRTKYHNMWKDRDGDGVANYYDRRDDNRYIW